MLFSFFRGSSSSCRQVLGQLGHWNLCWIVDWNLRWIKGIGNCDYRVLEFVMARALELVMLKRIGICDGYVGLL